MPEKQINRLCIIGVGLIGGSLARALKSAGAVGEIVGVGRHTEDLERAKQFGVIDHFTTSIPEGVKQADMVVLAVPMGAMQTVLEAIKPVIDDHMCITDVGSAKASIVRAMQSVFGKLLPNFVPGHPIAGTEESGVDASYAELFDGRRVILTPHAQTDSNMLQRVWQMWETCQAQVIKMDIEHHDEVLAATSHLPHMLAYALVDSLARMDERQEIFDYAAGGFRDFTRIASSSPEMWHDICLANRDALLTVMEKFSQDLNALTEAIRDNNSDYLKETFTRAKQARDKFCEK